MPYYLSISKGTCVEFLLACVMAAAGIFAARPGRIFLIHALRAGARAARSDVRLILLATALPIALRLALLGIDPPPVPVDMEEINHLLQAGAYAAGRLADPVHPLAVLLQFYQTVEWPHHMSSRPPLAPVFLAGGIAVANSPFAGNLLCVGLASGALCWMLLGWVPRRWAALGSAAAICTLCLFGYWVNSFWCPSEIALGAALLLGAVPRAERNPGPGAAVPVIIGLVLLAGTRPYENGIFAAIVMIHLALRIWRSGGRASRLRAAWHFGLPVAGVLAAILAGQALYDLHTTGNARLMPYQIWRSSQVVAPTFLWQALAPPRVFTNASAAAFCAWEARTFTTLAQGGVFGAALAFGRQAVTFRTVWGPLTLLPLLCWAPGWVAARLARPALLLTVLLLFTLLLVAFGLSAIYVMALLSACLLLRLRNNYERLPALLVLAGILATCLPAFYMNVYASALTAPLLILLVNGLRHLARGVRPAGPGLAGFLLLGCAIMPAAEAAAYALRMPITGDVLNHFDRATVPPRVAAESALAGIPGRLAVFVRVQDGAALDPVWLDPAWNGTAIDSQRIVWLRDVRPDWTAAAEHYYPDRQFYLLRMLPSGDFTLAPYPSATLPPPAPLDTLPMPDRAAASAHGARAP